MRAWAEEKTAADKIKNNTVKTVGQSTAQEWGSTVSGDSQSGFNFMN